MVKKHSYSILLSDKNIKAYMAVPFDNRYTKET